MPERVVVFLDYQNVYQGARRAFHENGDPHWQGQINPLIVAQFLASDSKYPRVLKQVRIYRGHPSNVRDPKGYAAARRQFHAWGNSPLVKVVARPLRYPAGWPDRSMPGDRPQEKGIDTALVLDFAVMAVRDEYDIGILFSTDTDMNPTLEFVADLTNEQGRPRAEVASWSGSDRRRLAVSNRNLFCHWIGKDAYEQMADLTVYSKP